MLFLASDNPSVSREALSTSVARLSIFSRVLGHCPKSLYTSSSVLRILPQSCQPWPRYPIPNVCRSSAIQVQTEPFHRGLLAQVGTSGDMRILAPRRTVVEDDKEPQGNASCDREQQIIDRERHPMISFASSENLATLLLSINSNHATALGRSLHGRAVVDTNGSCSQTIRMHISALDHICKQFLFERQMPLSEKQRHSNI